MLGPTRAGGISDSAGAAVIAPAVQYSAGACSPRGKRGPRSGAIAEAAAAEARSRLHLEGALAPAPDPAAVGQPAGAAEQPAGTSTASATSAPPSSARRTPRASSAASPSDQPPPSPESAPGSIATDTAANETRSRSRRSSAWARSMRRLTARSRARTAAVSFGVTARASWRSSPRRSASASERRRRGDVKAAVMSRASWVRARTWASSERSASAGCSRADGIRRSRFAPASRPSPDETLELSTKPPWRSVTRIAPSATSSIWSRGVESVSEAPRSTLRSRTLGATPADGGGTGAMSGWAVAAPPAADGRRVAGLERASRRCGERRRVDGPPSRLDCARRRRRRSAPRSPR